MEVRYFKGYSYNLNREMEFKCMVFFVSHSSSCSGHRILKYTTEICGSFVFG